MLMFYPWHIGFLTLFDCQIKVLLFPVFLCFFFILVVDPEHNSRDAYGDHDKNHIEVEVMFLVLVLSCCCMSSK